MTIRAGHGYYHFDLRMILLCHVQEMMTGLELRMRNKECWNSTPFDLMFVLDQRMRKSQ